MSTGAAGMAMGQGQRAADNARFNAENPLKDVTGNVMSVDGEGDELTVHIDTDYDGTVDRTISGVSQRQLSARVGEDEGRLHLAHGLAPDDPGSEIENDFDSEAPGEEVTPDRDGGDTDFTGEWLKIPDEVAFRNFCTELETLASGIDSGALNSLNVAPGGWTYFSDELLKTFGTGGEFSRATGAKLRELRDSLQEFAQDLRTADARYRDGKEGIWLSVEDVNAAVTNLSTATGGGPSGGATSSGGSDSGDSDSDSGDSDSD